MRSEPASRLLSPGEVVPDPTYSHVASIRPGVRVIHTAGQVGTRIDGTVPSSYVDQIHQALANLEACLAAAGASQRDVVKLTYYIVNYDPKNRPHAEILPKWLGGLKPATTLVPVPALAKPELLFEVEAVAAVRDPAGLLPFVRPPRGGVAMVDVVVVGAGLSGLQAGYDVQKAGFSCVVVEARDRVGGKTWTVPVNGGKGAMDVGAAWINSVNQSRMWALAQRFGLETVEQNVRGDAMSHEVGRFSYGALPKFSKADQDNVALVRDKFEELCHTIDIRAPWLHSASFDGQTVAELALALGATPTTLSTVTVWTRAMLGKDAHEVGALFFLDYVKSGGGLLLMRSDTYAGGQHLRIRQGTQSFSKGLAAAMTSGSVLLSAPVRKISQFAHGSVMPCAVTTKDGTSILCRKVIVSVPTPLYSDIEFAPTLPDSKAQLVSKTSLGFLSKVILVYAQPWWRSRGFCGLVQSFSGPISIARDTSVDADGIYALTCFQVGQSGILWSKLPTREERIAAVVKHIGEIYAAEGGPPPAPVEALIQVWNEEEWSKGGPSPVMGPGTMEAHGEALREVFGGVHFVGTETSFEWKGYMEGAVRSGERGAAEVIAALEQGDKSKGVFMAKL
ncbi:Amine oxidase [Pleurostoma richardsiae]|uniref:Amine oxidase n=1 Tax=Pleurostoma richardsiae TaxID=41990 RepID=A0AA38RFP3_9PEZI|nr:Amine oxidase [Pleurostoma richardsiae]